MGQSKCMEIFLIKLINPTSCLMTIQSVVPVISTAPTPSFSLILKSCKLSSQLNEGLFQQHTKTISERAGVTVYWPMVVLQPPIWRDESQVGFFGGGGNEEIIKREKVTCCMSLEGMLFCLGIVDFGQDRQNAFLKFSTK